MDDQFQATAHILYMFFWGSQAITVVQTRFHRNIVFRESNAQYAFGQGRNSSLMGVINIPLGMLMHKLSLSFSSVGLLGAQRAWHKMIVIVTIIHPIVARGSTFGVFIMYMGVAMIP